MILGSYALFHAFVLYSKGFSGLKRSLSFNAKYSALVSLAPVHRVVIPFEDILFTTYTS